MVCYFTVYSPDIDECADSQLNYCDSSDRATCTNTGGGFNCSCKTGYDDISPSSQPGKICKRKS